MGILDCLKQPAAAPSQIATPSDTYEDRLRRRAEPLFTLLSQLSEMRGAHAPLGAELATAEAEVCAKRSEISKLESDLLEADKAIVLAGSEFPDGPTSEELRLDRAKRTLRLATAKVKILQKRAAQSEDEINRKVAAAQQEYAEFARAAYVDAVVEFNRAAEAVCPIYAKVAVIWQTFWPARILGGSGPGTLVIENCLERDRHERWIINSEVPMDYPRLAGELPGLLAEIGSRFENAKKGGS